MSKSVIGVFTSHNSAERAVAELRTSGFMENEISILAKDNNQGQGGGNRRQGGGNTSMSYANQDVSDGATTGAWIGGAAGLLAGLGALAIPGVGPLLAAGPIAGALTGAVTGGLAGGLIDYGIPETEGRRYEQEVKQGSVLAIIEAQDAKAKKASDIFQRNGAKEVKSYQK